VTDWEERHRLSARTRKEFWENIKTTIKNNWLLDTLPLAIVILLFTIIFMTACAVHEPLPGLCYTDKTGTYLCSAMNSEDE